MQLQEENFMPEEKLTFSDKIFKKLPRVINPRYERYVKRKIAKLSKKRGVNSTEDTSPLLLDLFKTKRTLFGTKLKYSEEFILSVIEELVKSGKNINIRIDDKSLEMAVRFGCTRVVQALLEKSETTMDRTQYKKLLGIANENHDKAMTDLLVKRYGIPQSKKKIGSYFAALQRDPSREYDYTNVLENLTGYSRGLSSLWLYLKLLESSAGDADEPKYTIEWFYKVQLLLSKWNGGELSSLTGKERKAIKRFLYFVELFQHPNRYLPVSPGNLEQYVNLKDTKSRPLQKELSIVVKLSCGELGKKLDIILDGREAVSISSYGYMIALVKKDGKYIIYKPHSATGEIVLDSAQEAADWIFESLGYDKDYHFERIGMADFQGRYGTNKSYPLIFRGFTFEQNPRPYDTKGILAEISSNTKNNRDSVAPHMLATTVNCQASLEYYVEKGVDINARAPRKYCGYTALHFACLEGNLEMVQYLVGKGADIHARDNHGCTALHLACEKGNIEIVKYLRKAGAAIDIKNNKGNTALHLACEKGNIEIVKYLRKHEADIDIKNKEGNTAFHLACEKGNMEIVNYLREAGADIDIKNNKGKTALDFARAEQNLEVIKYLPDDETKEVKGKRELSFAESKIGFFSSKKEMSDSSLPNNNKTGFVQSLEDFFQALTSVKLWPSGPRL